MTANLKNAIPAEWAFFTALMAAAGLVGIYIPSLYFIAEVFLPVPVIFLVLRLDTRYSILGLAAAGLLMFALAPNPADVFVLVARFGLLGILLGLLFKNRVSSGRTLAVGLLGSAALALLTVGAIFILTGQNLFLLGEEGRQVVEQAIMANRDAGTFSEMPPEWQENFTANVINIFEMLIPGQHIVSSAAAAAITYFLSISILRRLNYQAPPAPAFTGIYFPWYSVWALIAGLALTLAGDNFALAAAAKAGKNILFVLFHAYMVLGIAVTVFFFRKIKLTLPLKIIFIVLAALNLPFSIAFVLLLGVLDPLINLRRLPVLK